MKIRTRRGEIICCASCGGNHSVRQELDNLSKECPKCERVLPGGCFGWNNSRNKLQYYCSACSGKVRNEKRDNKKSNRNNVVASAPIAEVIQENETQSHGGMLSGFSQSNPYQINSPEKAKGAEYIAIGQLLCMGMDAKLANGNNPSRKWDVEAIDPFTGVIHKIDVTTSESELSRKKSELKNWNDGNCHIAFVDTKYFLKLRLYPTIKISWEI